MTVYMLRDNDTGLYYLRAKSYSPSRWVEQSTASIWTTKNGRVQARMRTRRGPRPNRNLEVVSFRLVED